MRVSVVHFFGPSLVVMHLVACGGDGGGTRGPATSGVNPPAGGTSGMSGGNAGTTGTAGNRAPAGTGGSAVVGTAGESGSIDGGGGGGQGGTNTPAGGFDAGIEPNRNAVMPGNICDRLATIQCAAEAACCANPGRDIATCKRDMMSGCASDLMADVVAARPETGFDAVQAEAVFTHVEELASACNPTIAAFGASTQGLRTMFKGTFAPKASCKPQKPLDKVQAGAALASCTNGDSYACLPSAASWTCAAHSAANGPCFSDVNCQPGLFCNNPKLVVAAGTTCMTRKAVGASCMLANECQSLFCKNGKCVAEAQQAAYCLKP